mgnify:CR=1 FL=1
MVKKKTRRKIIKPPQPKLDTVFNCSRCGHKKTVEVKFIRKEKKAFLRCKSCQEKYETNIRPADAYIDIYYRWLDYLEKKENESSDEEKKEKKIKKKVKEDNEEKEYEEEEAPDSESDKNNDKENENDNDNENYDEEKDDNEEDEEREENEYSEQ